METTNKIISGERAAINRLPLTAADLVCPISSFSYIFLYNYVIDATALIAALKEVITINPGFGGRICGLNSLNPFISLAQNSVIFRHVSYAHIAPVYGIKTPVGLEEMLFLQHIDSSAFDQHTPLLQITYSSYIDGFIIGVSASHMLFDAAALIQLLSSWANVYKGQSIKPLPSNRRDLINMCRGNLPVSRHSAPVERLAYSCEPDFELGVFSIPASLIEELNEARRQCKEQLISLQDMLIAYIWRTLVRCQDPAIEQFCSLTITYDFRKALGLEKSYSGNAVWALFIKEEVGNIVGAEIKYIAKSIRGLYREYTRDVILSDLAHWMSRWRDKSIVQYCTKLADISCDRGIFINNLTKLPIHDLDFGGGVPSWFETPICKDNFLRNVDICRRANRPAEFYFYAKLPALEMTRLREAWRALP